MFRLPFLDPVSTAVPRLPLHLQLVIGIVGRMGLFDMAYRVGVPLAACMCLLGWCWFQGTKYIAPPQVVPQAAQVGS